MYPLIFLKFFVISLQINVAIFQLYHIYIRKN